MRLTIEKAEELCEKHNVKLGRGYWAPEERFNNKTCPNGLLLLQTHSAEEARKFVLEAKREWYGQWDHDTDNWLEKANKHVLWRIAEATNIPWDYALGLNNGFEGERGQQIPCDKQTDYYLNGLEDGQTLAAYAANTGQEVVHVEVGS